MLSPDTKFHWQPQPIQHLATGGIYTEAELKDYIRQINFPIERENILDNTANTISDYVHSSKKQETSFLPLSASYWKALTSKYWHKFEKFGIVSAGLFMIYLIIWLTIQFIKIIIRGLTLHKVFCFSIKLLAACLASLTQSMFATYKNDKTPNEANNHDTYIEMHTYDPKEKQKGTVLFKSDKNLSFIPEEKDKIYAEIHELPRSLESRQTM